MPKTRPYNDTPFDLTGRVAVVTGGAGLLGPRHAAALGRAGAKVVLADLNQPAAEQEAATLRKQGIEAVAFACDVTDPASVQALSEQTAECYGRAEVLVNNAANNPKMEAKPGGKNFSRLENFPLEQWRADLAVGLTGAMLCARRFGRAMAEHGGGVILNIASDLSLLAPDQRLYRNADAPADQQPVKPVTYSVVKSGLVGLTRYLATYWAEAGVRVNALSPGGVYNDQPEDFVQRLSSLIPLGRMADRGEYEAAVLFLCSDASSYMTGQNVVIDGGRSCW